MKGSKAKRGLQAKHQVYRELMEEYDLSTTYKAEFLRLEPRIRKIRRFTREEIMRTLFERVRYQVIRSAKDFRTLGTLFLRAYRYEEVLHQYLTDPDMTVAELVERTAEPDFVADIESVLHRLTARRNQGHDMSQEAKASLAKLRKLLNKSLKR